MAGDIVPREGPDYLETHVPEVDFALVLARVINSVKNDPAELRNAIYQLARVQLQRQGWQRNPPISIGEMHRLNLALETAIERVELISSKQDEVRALRILHQEIEKLEIQTPGATPHSKSLLLVDRPPHSTNDNRFLALESAISKPTRPSFSGFTPRNYLLGAACFAMIVAVTLYGISGRRSRQDPPAVIATEPTHETTDEAREPRLARNESRAGPSEPTLPAPTSRPLPTSYGIYALSNGQLHELEPLLLRVPDQRMFMSAVIQKPVQTILPEGRVEFVAFRRELATSAPDRVSIRVIARIKQAMAFSSTGEVTVSLVEDLWAIRNVSYTFRVEPLADNREMLLIHSDARDLVLSPGRYGLVLNGIAYDFSVAGDITDRSHCLERTHAANGIFYSECAIGNGKRDPLRSP
jgi:hypothetical protein